MKRKIFTLTFTLLAFVFAGNLIAGENFLHPSFSLKDASGNKTASASKVSADKTCAPCHDTGFISHNPHTQNAKASCIQCHVKGSKLTGDLSKLNLKIQSPTDENCASCHGFSHSSKKPLELDKNTPFGISQKTGEIISGQKLSDSALNLKNKATSKFAWDVHASRQVGCTSCHYTKNNPNKRTAKTSSVDYLVKDPRKELTTSKYLNKPDHNFSTADCQSCHNPFAVHKGLPYIKRHMESLNCQSCHVSKVFGPAVKAIDKTVVTTDGKANVEYRNVAKNDSKNINTQFIGSFEPFLFPYEEDGKNKIAPFNVVTNWTWVAKDGKAVSDKLIKKAYLSGKSYASDVVKAFDSNGNGIVEASELKLDSEKKVNLIKAKLTKLGVKEPKVKGEIETLKINHSVMSGSDMRRDCSNCHGKNSQLGKNISLSSYIPVGAIPTFKAGMSTNINGNVTKLSDGTLSIERETSLKGRYVFGFSNNIWLNILAIAIVLGGMGVPILHGGARLLTRKFRDHHETKTEPVYMYGFYERIWHWTMALSIILLIITGTEIHFVDSFSIFGLENAVAMHNILAFVLVVNAFLSLFFHIATGEIKQYFGFNRHFIKETIVQMFFYAYGIFMGHPHPIEKTKERKLNPLQQVTYVMILNFLLPFQIITGIMIVAVGRFSSFSDIIGGLTYLGPIHYIGSWAFLAFIITHVYLTTTGHTPLANMKAMITGYDDLEVNEEGAEPNDDFKKSSMKELVKQGIQQFKKNK